MKHHYLRKALPTDRGRYLKWMGDPVLRESAFGIKTDDPENDRARFEAMLADESCECYVYMDFFMALGEKRILRKEDGSSEVYWSVAEEFRGQGIEDEEAFLTKEERRDAAGKPADEKASGKAGKPVAAVKQRDLRFEALRVFSMLMIIIMHYLQMSGLVTLTPDKDGSAVNLAAWFLESLCLASVNVYVMISGYFSVDMRFSLRKLIRLWCEVFFYSVLIAAICFATGIVSFSDKANLFELQYLLLPIGNNSYWFATAYLLLYFFAPILGAGFRRLNRLQHGFILIGLLCFTCFYKCVFPLAIGPDDFGCGLRWFLTLYVLAAYIRLYGLPFAKSFRSAFVTYVVWAAMLIPYMFLMGPLERGLTILDGRYTLHFPDATKLASDYNSIFVLMASIGLFMMFVNMKKKEGGFFALLAKAAPFTFGVYLIHAHLYLHREEVWEKLYSMSRFGGALRIVHMLLVVLAIFLVCTLLDALRAWLFELTERLMDLCLKIYYAKKELWDYLIAGFLATVVSWFTYYIFAKQILSFMEETVRVLLGNAISWTITVIFAYVINRVFVFHSETSGFKAVGKEFVEFVAARLFSFGLDEGIMFLFVTVLGLDEILVKVLIASIVVIVVNYILSKLWIFRKPKAEKEEEKKA